MSGYHNEQTWSNPFVLTCGLLIPQQAFASPQLLLGTVDVSLISHPTAKLLQAQYCRPGGTVVVVLRIMLLEIAGVQGKLRSTIIKQRPQLHDVLENWDMCVQVCMSLCGASMDTEGQPMHSDASPFHPSVWFPEQPLDKPIIIQL